MCKINFKVIVINGDTFIFDLGAVTATLLDMPSAAGSLNIGIG